MEGPIRYEELQDDQLKSRAGQLFEDLFIVIHRVRSNSSTATAEIVAFNERVCREVTAKPNLARIILNDQPLLWYTCARFNELFHPAIKCLIETNSSALLGESELRADSSTLVHYIAVHPTHYVLMPWIAANYHWVLDHKKCLEGRPPVFDLLIHYVNRESEPTGFTTIIQQFFEAYPQGLTQVNNRGHTPLHAILLGSAVCEPDLFKWMAEQCPSNMLRTDNSGQTPLHIACWALTRNNHSSEICKYLIAKCPESVRIMTEASPLPIHFLLQYCQHQPVKEVVVCLLRDYPESYDIPATGDVVPSSIPFVNRIKPILDEERELKENIAYLPEVSGVFQDAVDGTENPSQLASSTCVAFSNWATITFVQRLEARLEQALTELQDECIAEEEQDHEQETDE